MSYENIKITPASDTNTAKFSSADEDIVIVAGIKDNCDMQEDRFDGLSSSPKDITQKKELEPASVNEIEKNECCKLNKTINDGYKETTLEDIKQSKMSSTQIAVVVVALICLASFIIWYVVFR